MSSLIFEEAMPGSPQEKINIISAIDLLLTKPGMHPKTVQSYLDEKRSYLGRDAETKNAMDYLLNANKKQKKFIKKMIDAKYFLTNKATPLIRFLTAQNLHMEISSRLGSELNPDNPNLRDKPSLARVKIIEYENNNFFNYANQLAFYLRGDDEKVTLQQISDAYSNEKEWENFKTTILNSLEEKGGPMQREVRDLFEKLDYLRKDANERAKDFDIKNEIAGSDIVSQSFLAQKALKQYDTMIKSWKRDSKELKAKTENRFKVEPPKLEKASASGVLYLKQVRSKDKLKLTSSEPKGTSPPEPKKEAPSGPEKGRGGHP